MTRDSSVPSSVAAPPPFNAPPTAGPGVIYDALRAFASRVTFAAPWDFLAPPADCYTAIADPAAAERQLRSAYGEAGLCAARVLVADGRGGLHLNPLLTTAGRYWTLLRDTAGQAFDVLVAAGCFSGGLPLAQLLRDADFRAALAPPENVAWIVFSMRDFFVLRTLGVPAALATGLDAIDLKGLCWLHELANGNPAKSAAQGASGAKKGLALTIVAGSLYRCNDVTPAALPALARHLCRARRYLQLDFYRVGVWRPDLGALEFYLRLRNTDVLRNCFRSGPSTYGLEDFQNLAGPPRRSSPQQRLQAAVANLVRLLASDRSDFYHETIDALQAYDAAVEEALIAPLQHEALTAADPQTATLDMLFAQAARELFAQFPALHATSRQRLEPHSATALAAPESQTLRREFTAQVGLLLRLAAARGEDRGPWARLVRGGGRQGGSLRRLAQQHAGRGAAAVASGDPL